MESSIKKASYDPFLKKIYILLILILFIKLGGFFTWSENVAITRIIKVITRVLMTFSIIYVQKIIVNKGAVASFSFSNKFSPLLYIGYLSLGFVSFLWSTNVGYSSLQWFMDLESLVFAYFFVQCFLLIDRYFPNSKIHLNTVVGNAVFLMILIFIIGMFLAPDQFYRMTHGGEEARLGGYFMNPNELGMLCAVGISCFLFEYYNKGNKISPTIKILLLLYALLVTGSRSSTIGFFIIAFFHIRQSSNIKLKYAMYTSIILLFPIAADKIMIKEGGLDEVLSMTGRLPFWKALLTEGLPNEPLFGFGFMRIAYKDYFQSLHTYAGQMTHNTFIQVIMNLGLVGFTLVLFQLFFTIKGIKLTEDKMKKLTMMGIFIPILINSFTEFGIYGETNYGILFYQILIFSVSLNLRKRLTKREILFLRKRRPAIFQLSQISGLGLALKHDLPE